MYTLRFSSVALKGFSCLASNQIGPTSIQLSATSSIYPLSSTNSQSHKFRHQFSTSQPVNKSPFAHLSTKSKSINTAIEGVDQDLPAKPKKPITPWIAFVRENKDTVLRTKERMGADELASILSEKWKSIDKTPYENEYKQRRDAYLDALQDYENSLTTEQREIINIKKNLKREGKGIKQLIKSKPPTLPRNPANMYCHSMCQREDIKERMKRSSPAKVFKELFQEYRGMSKEDKQTYVDMALGDKLRFEREFNEWFNSIKSDGMMSKTAQDQAESMRARFKALNYI